MPHQTIGSKLSSLLPFGGADVLLVVSLSGVGLNPRRNLTEHGTAATLSGPYKTNNVAPFTIVHLTPMGSQIHALLHLQYVFCCSSARVWRAADGLAGRHWRRARLFAQYARDTIPLARTLLRRKKRNCGVYIAHISHSYAFLETLSPSADSSRGHNGEFGASRNALCYRAPRPVLHQNLPMLNQLLFYYPGIFKGRGAVLRGAVRKIQPLSLHCPCARDLLYRHCVCRP